jgi:2-dehydro-3-deoxyphosphooctonate aldolase (KDO 8-P synthase)
MKLCHFETDFCTPFFLIAGTCVIESEEMTMEVAGRLRDITKELGINFIYKSSFEKANRTSHKSYRGLGLDMGLRILQKVKKMIRVPVLTDVHEDTPVDEVAEVVDVLQTPAFLCRQTNFINRVMKCGKPVNIKKGQFLSPYEMENVAEKACSSGNSQIMLCERGYSFGYNDLVVDMRSLAIMRGFGYPVVFDAGHSVQMPGSTGKSTGGKREFIPVLARAAVAVGINGLFIEVHPDPDRALCDGPNSLPLKEVRELLIGLKEIDAVVKGRELC